VKTMMRVLFAAALIVMAVGLGTIGQTGNGHAEPPNTGGLFTDVPRDHWAYEDLEYLAARGIITGLPGGGYNGDSPLDRYRGAAMIARAIKYMQSNPESVTPEDLNVLKNLIFQVSDDVAALQSGGVQGVDTTALEARVGRNEQEISALSAQVEELSGTSAATLTNRVRNNLIISLTAMLLGILSIALALLVR